jgi:hypothetical protein
MGFVRLAYVAAIVGLFASTGFAETAVPQPAGQPNAVATATPAEATKPAISPIR